MNSISLIDVPRSARCDPSTSHESADRIRRAGSLAKQQRLVLACVRRWPGCTSAELAKHYALPRYFSLMRFVMARRLPELAVKHVRRGKKRRCAVSRVDCVTWWPK